MARQGTLLYNIAFSIILIAGAIIVGFAVQALLMLILRRRHRRPDAAAGRKGRRFLPEHLKNPLRSLIPALFVSAVLPLLRFPKPAGRVVAHVVGLWVVASVAWLASGVVLVVRDAILGGYDFKAKDDLHARRAATQLWVIERVVIAVIVVVAGAVMLMTFPAVRQIGVSLLASAGVISVIVGLAAQKVLGNVLAGIQIALSQPIRLDDVVVVEEEFGRVEEITLTNVIVRLWDLRRLVLPISYFLEHPFRNWTWRTSKLVGTVLIYADYRVPVEEVRAELTRVLKASPSWDGDVNALEVTNATDRVVELRATMSAEDSSRTWDLRCEVREKLLAFLQEKHPESLPQVRLRMEGEGSAPSTGPRTEPEIPPGEKAD